MSTIVLFLFLSMLIVLWLDSTSYIIPNWLISLMLVVYPLAVSTAHSVVDWKMAVLGAVLVLVGGYVIFTKQIMGAGDIKLMTACALWVGFDNLFDFFIAVTLMGGAFAVGILGVRKALSYLSNKSERASFVRILRDGEPMPYGIAIAAGFLLMMETARVPVLL